MIETQFRFWHEIKTQKARWPKNEERERDTNLARTRSQLDCPLSLSVFLFPFFPNCYLVILPCLFCLEAVSVMTRTCQTGIRKKRALPLCTFQIKTRKCALLSLRIEMWRLWLGPVCLRFFLTVLSLPCGKQKKLPQSYRPKLVDIVYLFIQLGDRTLLIVYNLINIDCIVVLRQSTVYQLMMCT